jgi:hypothetical protein
LKRKSVCAPVRNSSLFGANTAHVSYYSFQNQDCARWGRIAPPSSATVSYLQAQRDVPIAVVVVLLEHIRHALQADARLHEQVEAHVVVAAAVVGGVQQLDELRGEAVAEGDEGGGEFRVRDAARAVGVEAVEEVAPGGEEAPETAGGC